MTADLQPYPAYRDSGVKWLSDVPAHWEVLRLRTIAELRVSNVDKHVKYGERPARLCNYVDVYKNDRIGRRMAFTSATATPGEIERFRLRCGDVLITKDSETWNDIGVPALVESTDDGIVCGYHLALLRPFPDHIEGGYLFRALQSSGVAHQFHVEANGVTRFGLTHDGIKSIWLPVPSLPEQAAIVCFLDHADRRIRRHIRAKQKLIALLEEQKQAIIHQAVTGQIDVRTGEPYPSYKVSREEWLAVVPAHWEVRRLKSLVRRIDQGVSPQAENYHADGNAWGVLRAGCVNGGVFRETEHKRLAPDFVFAPILVVTTGDVLVSRANGSPHLVGSVGRVSSLRHQLILSDKTFRPIFNQEIEPDFMVLAMNSRYYRQQVEQAISGAEGLANNLPLSSLRSFHFAVPTFEEQHDIVRYLQESTHKFSAVAARAKREVALLDEYRTRLISDVVTGKLDVREAAAGLPEVDPLAVEGDSVDGVDHEAGSERTGWRHAVEEGGPLADGADP